MQAKRTPLAEKFKAKDEKPIELATDVVAVQPMRTKGRAPSRVGKKPVTAFLSEEAAAQLKVMAAVERTSQEALLIEAINDLFQKRGKGTFA